MFEKYRKECIIPLYERKDYFATFYNESCKISPQLWVLG